MSKWNARWANVGALIAARATQAPLGEPWGYDADRSRQFRDLDAIRVHFPDHA